MTSLIKLLEAHPLLCGHTIEPCDYIDWAKEIAPHISSLIEIVQGKEYSDELPTEPGWYWVKSGYTQSEDIVEVFYRPGHSYLCVYNYEDCQHDAVAKMGAKWSGPLPNPPGEKAQ